MPATESGWKNGDTALSFIYDQMKASVEGLSETSSEIEACLKEGFEGCPPKGVNFHHAIGRATMFQNTALASVTSWNQKQVAMALRAEEQRKRRATDRMQDEPELEYQGFFGKIKAHGTGSMATVVKFVMVIVVGCVLIYGIRMASSISDKLSKVSAMVEKAERLAP